MRRPDQEITEQTELEAILDGSPVCRVGFNGLDFPYVVPVCFGRLGASLYFHCSRKGKKLDLIRSDNRICFEAESGVEVVQAERACKWTVRFRSVIGHGRAHIVEVIEEKILGLNAIMEHYSGSQNHQYDHGALDITCVVRIDIESMTGKMSKE